MNIRADRLADLDRDKNEDLIRYPYYIGLQPPCFYEWCIDSVPQPQLDNETRHMTLGKGVGGGSLINGMLWNRGAQVDYENWASLGNPAWNWTDILPYFKKVQDHYCLDLCLMTDKSSVGELQSTVVR